MRTRPIFAACTVLSVVGLFAGVAAAAPTSSPAVQQAQAGIEQALLAQGVSRWSIQTIALPAQLGRSFNMNVNLGGANLTFALDPTSVRAANAQAFEQRADGRLHQIPLPEPRTYMGEIIGLPDAHVRGSLLEGGFSGVVWISGPQPAKWVVQPLSNYVPGAAAGQHVVYNQADVVNVVDGRCGVDDEFLRLNPAPIRVDRDEDQGEVGITTVREAKIAFDTDWEYYASNGSSSPNTIADIDQQLLLTNFVFERDTDITHRATNYTIRTSQATQPYTTNGQALLGQFQNTWNATQGGVDRNVAHLMAGRPTQGGILGIAFLSVVCNLPQAYGITWTRWTTNIVGRYTTKTHELGHNWSAQHCDGASPCFIMCATAGGCNGNGTPPQFEAVPTQQSIVSYRNGVSGCLGTSDGVGLPLPVFEPFPSTLLSDNLWDVNNGGLVNSGGLNPPSAPFALNLDSTDTITTGSIRAGDVASTTPIYLSFFSQRRGVEAGKSLRVEYLNSANAWIQIASLGSDGVDQSTFVSRTLIVPADGYHNNFRVRFSALGADFSDDWYIDNFSVSTTPPTVLTVEFIERVPSLTLSPTVWSTNNGVLVSSSGTNPPSAPFMLNLDGTDNIQTQPFQLAGFDGTQLFFSYFLQARGVLNGQSFFVDVLNASGTWVTVDTYVHNGVDQTVFTRREVALPLTGYSNNWRFRLRAGGVDFNNDWFVDDMAIRYAGTEPPSLPLPFADSFPSTTLDANKWPGSTGVVVNNAAISPPSAPNAAEIDSTDVLQSARLQLGGLVGTPVYASFWSQRTGVEAGEQLLVEYFNSANAWTPLTTLTSDGANQNRFGFSELRVPANGYSNNFRIRFRLSAGADASDDWFVDDVAVRTTCSIDIDLNGAIDINDFFAYLLLFSSNDSRADTNRDGSVDINDFFGFLSAFSAGCPV